MVLSATRARCSAKNAAVGEFGGVTGPGHSQAPGFFGLLGAGGSDFADRDLEERLEAPVEHPNTFGADERVAPQQTARFLAESARR